jgi:hypothetical protein
MIGYRGHSNWIDMGEFVVHFTRARGLPKGDGSRPYWDHLSILWDGCLKPSDRRLGAADSDMRLGDSQRSVCFSEVPLGFVERLAKRRGSPYGIGFTQDFVRSQGAARVWYLDKDEPAAWAFQQVMAAHRANFDASDPFWRLTPLVVQPRLGYRFEWEREWRLPGHQGLRFTTDDIAFLFIPEKWHSSARGFFDSYAPGTAPNPDCPFIDPNWDGASIERALADAN